MYEYTYETLYVGGGFWMNNADCQHRQIITDYAAQGWRYVGYIPTRFSGEGAARRSTSSLSGKRRGSHDTL